MRKLFFNVLLVFVTIGLYAQNGIDYYEYWFDNNVAGKVSQNITPVSQFQLNTTLPTTGLSSGLHTVHLRFRDENNRYSSVISAFFLKNETSTATTNQMSSYEYWFDQNYAGRVSGSLPSSQWVNFSALAPTTGLSGGLHTVHMRFKDANGQWSSVLSQFFLKQETTTAPSTPALTEYQYWFNSDYANAQTVAMSGNQTEQVLAAINANSLQPGLNIFHVRFKDVNGQWSSVLSQFFLKLETTTAPSTPALTEYQYWFNSDDANAQTVAMSGNQTEQVLAAINANSLQPGLNTFHVRFKDANGQWSSVLSSFFIKNTPASTLSNSIQAYRYWFDQNSTNMVNITISSPQQTVSITDPVSMVQIPKGTHTIHFQFLDAQGFWSSVTTDTIYKNSLPIAQFEADSTKFCDTGLVQFSNNSIDGEEYFWDFGDGQTSTDANPLHTYAAPGVYTVSLTTSDPTAGLDSTLTQVHLIKVYETPDASIHLSGNDTICAGTSVTLSSATPPANYLWSDGTTNATLDVNTAGSYWVEVSNIDFAACVSHSDTIDIAVAPLPEASFTFSNVDHVVSFTNNSLVADSYFWNFGDGNTSNDTNPVHDYAINGLYTVYLVAYNFCGTDTAFAIVDLRYVGLGEEIVYDKMYLYPNPTRGAVTVKLPTNVAQGLHIIIYSERGDLVAQKDQSESDSITLDLSDYQNGIYFIQVSSANGWYGIQKVIVNR